MYNIYYCGNSEMGSLIETQWGHIYLQDLPTYDASFYVIEDEDHYDTLGSIKEDAPVFEIVGGGTITFVIGTKPPHR